MPSGPVLLDNTILTNFALVKRPDLVLNLWGTNSTVTPEVIAEYMAGVNSRKLPADIWGFLVRSTLQPEEQVFADQLPSRLGRGERSSIAVAFHREGLFVSDDAEARREAIRCGLKITGSIGILVLNVRQGRLAAADGNAILNSLIIQGYRSPVSTLDALL